MEGGCSGVVATEGFHAAVEGANWQQLRVVADNSYLVAERRSGPAEPSAEKPADEDGLEVLDSNFDVGCEFAKPVANLIDAVVASLTEDGTCHWAWGVMQTA